MPALYVCMVPGSRVGGRPARLVAVLEHLDGVERFV